VVFNFLGSRRHLDYLKEALEGAGCPPCLGGLTRDAALKIPERHLGLVTGEEFPLEAAAIEKLADSVERGLDLDRLLALLSETPSPSHPAAPPTPNVPVFRPRIGVARDEAFCFYYADNLDRLATAGAELVYFSPLRSDGLPPELDGLIFGGGYPELFAGDLARNTALRGQVAAHCAAGMPIYAECGGFMYLCRELIDAEGAVFPMVGVFPRVTRMLPRLKTLGYREATLACDTPIGKAGLRLRGHEYHYSELVDEAALAPEIRAVYRLTAREGRAPRLEGFLTRRCLGSYVHLHFGSAPAAAVHFVNACREHHGERKPFK
jgi:cobyrinic acid a,c-diamide synthase